MRSLIVSSRPRHHRPDISEADRRILRFSWGGNSRWLSNPLRGPMSRDITPSMREREREREEISILPSKVNCLANVGLAVRRARLTGPPTVLFQSSLFRYLPYQSSFSTVSFSLAPSLFILSRDRLQSSPWSIIFCHVSLFLFVFFPFYLFFLAYRVRIVIFRRLSLILRLFLFLCFIYLVDAFLAIVHSLD